MIRPHLIELSGGRCGIGGIEDTAGVRPDYSVVGEIRFFVDLIEHDGCRSSLWDGCSYDAAIAEAEAARREWGLTEPVRDCVVGDSPRASG